MFLIQFVSTWANFLLPTMMLTTPEKQPLAVGLVTWQATIQTGNPVPTNILIFGAFFVSAATCGPLPSIAALLEDRSDDRRNQVRNKTWQTCTVSVAVDCCSEAVSL